MNVTVPMTTNHFEVLGIKPGCSDDDVKKAYRGLAKKFHPDKNKDHGAEETFKEILAAYDYLKSEDRREILERELNSLKQDALSTDDTRFSSNFARSKGKLEKQDNDAWSKMFQKFSDKRYEYSTFGCFGDDGKESVTKTQQKQTTKSGAKTSTAQPSRPQSAEWTVADDPDQNFDDARSYWDNFSFAFKSFVNDLELSFDFFMSPDTSPEFSSFIDAPDPFDDFLTVSDNVQRRMFSCIYCEKRMPFNELCSHEPSCGERHKGRLVVNSDEDDVDSTTLDDIFGDSERPFEDQCQENTGDWRQTLEHAKSAQVNCKWCGRCFSHTTAKYHIPFCETWTREHGSPLNSASKPPTPNLNSKHQKAKEYEKHIRKPRGLSGKEDNDSVFPSYFDHPLNIGMHRKKEAYKPSPTTSSGQNSSHTTQGKSSPKSQKPSSLKSQVSASSKTPDSKRTHTAAARNENPFECSYGIGVTGTQIKSAIKQKSKDCCPICKKRFGVHGQLTCTCRVWI